MGFLFSSFVAMYSADLIGRKKVILMGLALHAVINFLLLMLPKKLFMLYIYMSLLGVRAPMASHVVSVMNYEYGVTKIRGFLTACTTLIDNITGILLSVFFYYAKDWRILFWFNFALVNVCFIIILIVIPESPRFYMARGRFDQARNVFKTLAKRNKRQMFQGNLQGQQSENYMIGHAQQNFQQNYQSQSYLPSEKQGIPTKRKHKCIDLLKSGSNYRVVAFIMPVLYLLIDIVFYGIIFGLKNLKGNIYINGIVAGGADVVAAILIAIFSNRIGRKTYLLCAWGALTIACFIYYFLQDQTLAQYVCVLFGKLGATSTFSLIFLSSAETFPTNYRGTMLGISNGFARIGGAIAPIISDQISFFILLYSGFGVIGFILTFFIHETRGMQMVDEIQDGQCKQLLCNKVCGNFPNPSQSEHQDRNQ